MQEGTKFNYTFEYNKRDLKYLMNSLYLCYLKIISEINSVSHRENDIRDIFISDQYLNNNKVKEELGVSEFLFDKETPTPKGRADIRIIKRNRKSILLYRM